MEEGAYGSPAISGPVIAGTSEVGGFAPIAGELEDVGEIATEKNANGAQSSTAAPAVTVEFKGAGTVLNPGRKTILRSFSPAPAPAS